MSSAVLVTGVSGKEKSMTSEEVTGVVKWFDSTKGFGFITPNGGGKDILLHKNVLKNFGQNSVADGAVITVEVSETPRGVQAAKVIKIESSETVPVGQLSGRHEKLQQLKNPDASPFVPARVKWFDSGKGYGFVNVFARSDDVFVHADVLQACSFATLVAGEAVLVRVIEADRGPMAVAVASWLAASQAVVNTMAAE